MQNKIRIGSRKSKLALVQTELVKQKIEEAFPDIQVEIVGMSTKGDEILNRSLTSFGGKGVFTQELEEALLSGEIDLAVHSAKDMPMIFSEGLHIGAVLKRGNVEDVIVTCDGTFLRNLKPGSVVGTGSLRREIQIKNINPLVKVELIRGNVQTRLRKLSEGQYDAIVLAAAGIDRLGLFEDKEYYFEYLNIAECLPAAGQAILAVESKIGHLTEVLERINDQETLVCLSAERAYLTAIGGSCNAPVAAHSFLEGDILYMDALDCSIGKRVSGSKKTGLDQELAAQLGRELANFLHQGKVFLVGAGPGDRNLVTEKCLSCIRDADVIVYDNLATDSLLNEARPNAELIYAGKRASNHHLKQDETNALLIAKAKEGKNVVRLKGGDPFIFGRGGEEAQELVREGISFEIVPGVSSCYSAPAYAGIPVTHRDFASSFHVITGHEKFREDGCVLDYHTLAKEEGTLIFLMGLSNLPNIVKNLIMNGKDPKTPAAVIQEGTTARQKTAIGTLETIVEEVERVGIQTPAISVVGDVVKLQDEISWLEHKPLSGKKILITATKKMAEELSEVLAKEGAEPVNFSLIRTEPILSQEVHDAIADIGKYSWVVFTSGNGVDLYFDLLMDFEGEKGRDIRQLASVKIAVIGKGTKDALARHGIWADFCPSKYSSKDLAAEWVPTLKKEDKVLLLRASEASKELNTALDSAGIVYDDVALYRTVIDFRKSEELNRILPQVDYVTLCSNSAVKAFATMKDKTDFKAKVVCIGPVTEKAATKAGLPVIQSAVEYTAEGIRDAIFYDILSCSLKKEKEKTDRTN